MAHIFVALSHPGVFFSFFFLVLCHGSPRTWILGVLTSTRGCEPDHLVSAFTVTGRSPFLPTLVLLRG